jgi:uncharacterized membrane protein YoaK (UPF0700 family)
MRFVISRCGGVLLAFAAGFVDTATFLQVSELFSAHITGNFVVFAIALVHGLKSVDWLKLLALAVFFVGVPFATFIYDRAVHRIRAVLVIEALLLVAAAGLAMAVRTPAMTAFIAMMLVLAMAIQNAAHQLQPSLGASSAVMTTNAAKLFVVLWRKVNRPTGFADAEKADGIAARILTFALGCVASGFATHKAGLAAVILPATLVALVAASQDSDRRI